MKLLKQLYDIGVKPHQEAYLKDKVRLSNRMNLLLMVFISLPFIVLSLVFYGGHRIFLTISLFGLCFELAFFVINYLGGVTVSRLALVMVSTVISAVYHALLIGADSQPIASIFMVQMGFSMLTFILFDKKEWPYILLMALFSIAVFFSFDWLNSYFEADVDDTLFRVGILFNVLIIVALIMAFTTIYVLVKNNTAASLKNQTLATEMAKRDLELERTESKLRSNIERLKASQDEEHKRNWANEGLARFGETLRSSNKDIETLSDALMSNLVKYMNFNQGALFVLQNEKGETFLELMSCYAYQRKKYLDKKIDMGKGLLAQAVIEQKTILLQEVPDEYVNITSGVGAARPKSLLVVPMMVNGEAYGALELAAFEPIEEYQVSFIEKLSESIASNLSSAKTNSMTQGLLQNAQELTEQMREQEEEMRQNMEELQATHEEMERNQKEIERTIEEEKKVFENEIDAQDKIIQELESELKHRR